MSAPYPTDDRNQGYPPYPPTGPGYPPAGGPGYPPAGGPGYPTTGFAPPPMPGYPDQGYQGYPPQQPTMGFSNPGYGNPNQTGYPGYNVPGYPQPNPYQQPGYDPGDKPLNPPYMDPNDPNYKAAGFGFDDKSIRAGFIRRVYSILSIQLLVTLAFVCWMVLHEPTQRFIHSNPAILIPPAVGSIVLVCVIACCEDLRRSSPCNLILLAAFTLCEAVVVGVASSQYEVKVVIQALALTAAITIGLTIFAFQTKWDFTLCGGALCVIFIIFAIGSFIGMIFFRNEFFHFIMACFGACIFSIYIVYDTQMMMGGEHKYSISPEEYVFAALNLYMDIIQLFLYLLRILRYLNND